VINKAVEFRPDIIAFSITTGEYSWMSVLARKAKAHIDVPVICGGAHPTFYPDVIKDPSIDIICRGEGEGAILDLVSAMVAGRETTGIRNLMVKKDGRTYSNDLRPLIEDLDSIPYADRNIYDKYSFFREQKQKHRLTARGCPFQCSFCFNRLYNEMYRNKGKVVRRRSVRHVIDEIGELKANSPGLGHIFFLDDTFILSEDWVDEFLDIYKKEIRLPFSCTARANLITRDLVQRMKDARCFSIRLGIESGDDHTRNDVLKKGVTKNQIESATAIIKEHGIRLLTYNMVGTPGETLENALKTFLLNKRIHPTYAWCSLLQPYPGTEIYEYALSNGYLSSDHNFEDMESSYFMTSPVRMENGRQIQNLQKVFALGVALRFPTSLMKFLIELPFEAIYEKMFQAVYALGISRMDNIGMRQLFRTAAVSKDYFKKVKKLHDLK
jgi:radical SAM superfamily enzyme YgiQ (UPF0313 family)